MRKFLYIILLFLIHISAHSQSIKDTLQTNRLNINVPPVKTNSITFHLTKVSGIGPSGFTSNEIATTDIIRNSDYKLSAEEFKAYPVMKNKPANLTDVVEYFYLTDPLQFYYQKYVAGKYSKSFLAEEFKNFKRNLSDTAKLSRVPLKCYISVIGGLNENKEPVYILDANNNGDYADDILRPLLKNTHDENLTINAAVPVITTYVYKGRVKEENKLVFIQQAFRPNLKQFALQFSFPEFRYLRFNYKGQPYMVCTSSDVYHPFYTIVPDKPYFVGLGSVNRVQPGQFVQIGDENFKLSNVADSDGEITLTGPDISGFSSDMPPKTFIGKTTAKNHGKLISRQIGYLAPSVSGININPAATPGTIITTTNLRGKYVFIDFWSTSCGPCIDEFQYLKEVYAKYNPSNLEIIGVADERSKDATILLIKQHNVLWPNIKTKEKTTQITAYNDIVSYPTTYLLDPMGKIIAVDLRAEALMNKLKTLIALNK